MANGDLLKKKKKKRQGGTEVEVGVRTLQSELEFHPQLENT